jgi:hypothetical protein
VRQIIKWAAQSASATHATDPLKYHILLMLTDGEINGPPPRAIAQPPPPDLAATVDEIISASTLPLSIVIVGVGNADFSAMAFLDSDAAALTNGVRTAMRDIVQVRGGGLGVQLSDWEFESVSLCPLGSSRATRRSSRRRCLRRFRKDFFKFFFRGKGGGHALSSLGSKSLIITSQKRSSRGAHRLPPPPPRRRRCRRAAPLSLRFGPS